MKRRRYTVVDLRNHIEQCNQWLADCGSLKRLTTGGRNGYQAVDVYSVDDNGERIGSGVDRMLCGGSSRECSQAASDFYGQEFRKSEK